MKALMEQQNKVLKVEVSYREMAFCIKTCLFLTFILCAKYDVTAEDGENKIKNDLKTYIKNMKINLIIGIVFLIFGNVLGKIFGLLFIVGIFVAFLIREVTASSFNTTSYCGVAEGEVPS